MTYAVRLKQDGAWLDLLNERGETEVFSTRAAAIIRGKALLEAGQAQEVEVRWNGQEIRMWLGPDGLLRLEGAI